MLQPGKYNEQINMNWRWQARQEPQRGPGKHSRRASKHFHGPLWYILAYFIFLADGGAPQTSGGPGMLTSLTPPSRQAWTEVWGLWLPFLFVILYVVWSAAWIYFLSLSVLITAFLMSCSLRTTTTDDTRYKTRSLIQQQRSTKNKRPKTVNIVMVK